MTRNAYRRPPEEVDMIAEERAIRRRSTLGAVLTLACFTAAYWIGPHVADLPTAPADRLLFAALHGAIPAVVLMVAILMVSTARRFSAADIGG
ncbi:hypothetical protein [Pararhodobacter sp. SW119]|uniref:hypothetical protein n=1 Tax=Pararhodobacter sp. SW119 TaxID=2780075 RepID=UPI001AE0AC90|nr:hypothetical protein [Pararhodobacter sp. SW119]